MLRSPWLLLYLLVGACASGSTGTTGREDSGPSGTDVPRVDTASACVPSCRSDESCISGVCISAGVDVDEDGLPIEVDCDDTDPLVGRTGNRACATECGDGVEVCSEGIWGTCSAECGCIDGAAQMIPCGANCGRQAQVCVGGRWEDSGACSGEGVCPMGSSETRACDDGSPQVRMCDVSCAWGEWTDCSAPAECTAGQIDRESRPCGSCGGTEERTRTCVSGFWGSWSGYGSCTGDGGECTAGQTDTETGSCSGSCGTRTRTRTCSSDCRWGGYGAWSGCSGGACSPGQTRACANGDSCGEERCTSSCTWAGCAPRPTSECLRIRPGTSGPPGNNYQCCTTGGGARGWQFCLSSCQWSVQCDAHSC